MPLYNLKCKCTHTFQAFFRKGINIESSCAICPECSSIAYITGRADTINIHSVHFFPSGIWEHIAPQPLEITSRRQLKEECAKHDVYAKYLDPPITLKKPTY